MKFTNTMHLLLFLTGILSCSEPPKKRSKTTRTKPISRAKRRTNEKSVFRLPSKKQKRDEIELKGKVRVLKNITMLAPPLTIERLAIPEDTPCIHTSAMNPDASYYVPSDWHAQGHPLLACDEENVRGINIFPQYLPLSWFENKNEGDKIQFPLYLPDKKSRLIALTCVYFEYYSVLSSEPNTLAGYIQNKLDFVQSKRQKEKLLLEKIKARAILKRSRAALENTRTTKAQQVEDESTHDEPEPKRIKAQPAAQSPQPLETEEMSDSSADEPSASESDSDFDFTAFLEQADESEQDESFEEVFTYDSEVRPSSNSLLS